MFYLYAQNNSGGRFITDKKMGIANNVIIEAQSPRVADALAEDKGLYFNGCAEGRDCDCCGDRWSSAGDYDASEVPSVYGSEVVVVDGEGLWESDFGGGWTEPDGYIHYLDGRVVPFNRVKK